MLQIDFSQLIMNPVDHLAAGYFITFLLSEPSYDAKNIIYLLKIVKFLVIVLSTSLKKCRNRTTLTLLNYNLCNGGLLQQKNADWIIFQETN